MIERNSPRDIWKLAHWEEFIQGVNFSIPKSIDDPEIVDDLLLFYNSTHLEYKTSMRDILEILEGDRE